MCLIEIVGPAGAGKSTITNGLLQCSNTIQLGSYPNIRSPKNIPFFIRNSFSSLPMLSFQWQHDRGGQFARTKSLWLIILKGWHRVLAKQVSSKNSIVLLDQGPIFMLGWFLGFYPQYFRGKSARIWWEKLYRQWSGIIDLMVWLDAPDQILVERIRDRNKWHSVKDKSDHDSFRFLENWRQSLKQAYTLMSAGSDKPRILKFDTTKQSADEIIEEIIVASGMDIDKIAVS